MPDTFLKGSLVRIRDPPVVEWLPFPALGFSCNGSVGSGHQEHVAAWLHALGCGADRGESVLQRGQDIHHVNDRHEIENRTGHLRPFR